MRGSVLIAGALLGAVSLVGAPVHAAAPDPYSGSIETDCNVSVPADIEPGERVKIKISVAANNPTPPDGKVTISITTKPGGALVWDKTVTYNGGTKTVTGPVLDPDQDYSVASRFNPSDNTFAKCRASAAVDAGEQDADDDSTGPGGLLPDTGGPPLLWLLLGLTLVGGGTATVVYARRRNAPATV